MASPNSDWFVPNHDRFLAQKRVPSNEFGSEILGADPQVKNDSRRLQVCWETRTVSRKVKGEEFNPTWAVLRSPAKS